MRQIIINTTNKCQMLDITDQVARIVKEEGRDAAAVLINAPHTTAGITVNECADPTVSEDILEYLEKRVPTSHNFRHSEGNSDAHIKSTLTGVTKVVPVVDGKMVLGTWQGIFFAEFDGPRTRKIFVTLLH
ncbi:MAG: YjbQ family protein [Phycisphaerae bacterium]|jgi:secondary thiamine-phosphate synthase enzyme|nr:YjbQ family protein [Phycisphaerae bacterium]